MTTTLEVFVRELWRKISRRDWRAGHEYADEIIRLWSSGDWSDAEKREQLQSGPLSRETDFSSTFAAGYSVRWQECGSEDAAHGSVRARKFRSHSYNMGWWNEMVERRRWGWHHERLDAEFQRMQTLYWDRIAKGRSDDYYDHP